MGLIIRGSVKSKRLSCATLVLSGVGRARGFRFKIGSAVASDGPGAPVGLSCAATVETSNRDTKAPEKNARRVCLVVNINPPTFSEKCPTNIGGEWKCYCLRMTAINARIPRSEIRATIVVASMKPASGCACLFPGFGYAGEPFYCPRLAPPKDRLCG